MYFHWLVQSCNYEFIPIIIRNTAVVPVVVDPVIASKLCPCQRQGVAFMYESVMGLKKHEGQGCILADEMYVSFYSLPASVY